MGTMPARFSIIPARAIEDPRLHSAALRVLSAIGTYANKEGWCYPSQSTLAKRLKISRPAVNRQIKILVELGYLEATRRVDKDGGETSCIYHILFEEDEIEYSQAQLGSMGLPANMSPEDVREHIAHSIHVVTPEYKPIQKTPLTSYVTPPVTQLCYTPAQKTGDKDHSEATPLTSIVTPPVTAGVTPPVTSDVTQTPDLTPQLMPLVEIEKKEDELILSPAEKYLEFDIPASPAVICEIEVMVDDDGLELELPLAPSTSKKTDCLAGFPGGSHSKFVDYPESPLEAHRHPDLRIYILLTGITPAVRDYKTIIDVVRFFRLANQTDQALAEYLRPFWLRWKISKRRDGTPYKPMNLAWLTDWAVSGVMPERPDETGDWVVSTSPEAFNKARIPMPEFVL
jgi:hypothetical protein